MKNLRVTEEFWDSIYENYCYFQGQASSHKQVFLVVVEVQGPSCDVHQKEVACCAAGSSAARKARLKTLSYACHRHLMDSGHGWS